MISIEVLELGCRSRTFAYHHFLLHKYIALHCMDPVQ